MMGWGTLVSCGVHDGAVMLDPITLGGSEELLGQAYPTNSILSDPLLLCEVGYNLGCGLSLDYHVGDAKAVGP